jgi:hypothetical protein
MDWAGVLTTNMVEVIASFEMREGLKHGLFLFRWATWKQYAAPLWLSHATSREASPITTVSSSWPAVTRHPPRLPLLSPGCRPTLCDGDTGRCTSVRFLPTTQGHAIASSLGGTR